MDEQTRNYVIDFTNRSFRDVADRDYISARVLYRSELGQQFLWSALQAIEKYLKAILVYNGVSTKNLRHDLEAGFNKLVTINDIPFKFPKDVRKFIVYLNREGANRYFEYPAYTIGDELPALDRTVWHIRRYCFYMRGERKTNSGIIDLLPLNLNYIHRYKLNDAHKFRITGGFLESLLGKSKNQLRKHLVWKNFYYGSYRKNKIKQFPEHISLQNPTHYLHPEAFKELDRLVKFSEPVRDYCQKEGWI